MKKIVTLTLLAVLSVFLVETSVHALGSCETLFVTDRDLRADSTKETIQKIYAILDQRHELKTLQDQQSQWAQFSFSDPGEHDPDNFIYLIHTMNTGGLKGMMRFLDSTGTPQSIDLVEHPDQIGRIPVISASLVGKKQGLEKTVTYQNGLGFILKVPAENILAARKVDMQTGVAVSNFQTDSVKAANSVAEIIAMRGLPTPINLLEETPDRGYNEVLILGTGISGRSVEIVGVFSKSVNGVNFISASGDEATLKTMPIITEQKLPYVVIDSARLDSLTYRNLIYGP